MMFRSRGENKPETSLAKNIEHFLSAKERARGLLKYDRAPESHAAIFDLALRGFLPIVHTFGMKFSIDIVFCSASKVVRAVYKNVGPSRLIAPARFLLGGCPYLIELSRCDASDLSVGDRLRW